ncbi:C-type mannose receptor 2-like [Salmo trutta]|uniref:C-type mannose receptor 2-like n=1 Tax=Salmo trutta TaxID=8032 RepID=UPI001130D067|nr:C-type mannose receptor 2-like [Salmo trutta]
MDLPLFLVLVFSGLSILPSSLPHQFHFLNMTKTWTEAQSFCRQIYTDLATIDDMADMKKLNNTVSAKIHIFFFFFYYLQTFICICILLYLIFFQIETNVTNKYILIAEHKTWSQAQLYCRQKHTDLASVRNTTERDAIKSILPKVTDIYRVWIGLKKSLGVWRWSDQSGSSYRNWETYKKNNADYQNGEICGEVTFPSGEWNYQGCTTNTHFICYDDELVLVTENKTWSEALWHCRDLDMELVSAHNQSIQHWVQQRAKKASSHFVWLGLRYTCTLDFWFWVNGEESCYHNWADREGYNTSKEQCGNTGAIQRDGGQWVGKAENERFNFICSKSDDY